MERLALNDIIRWNNSSRRKPLIVWGARQVGKTYLILELFAKNIIEIIFYTLISKKKMTSVISATIQPMRKNRRISFSALWKGNQ